jgi:hemerythrin-like domain-containing protein
MPNDTIVDHDPYAVLAREHRLIERALDVLGRLCEASRRSKGLNAADATQLIQFLRDFADRTHHLKEERILFPAIESRTFFPGCGLASEHQLGRERVKGMADAVERSLRGDAEGVRAFLRQARSLIGMLRAHIAKEDDCLAGVAHRAFSREEGERLTQEFDEMERREIGERTFERFAAVVEALEAKYSDDDGDSARPARLTTETSSYR